MRVITYGTFDLFHEGHRRLLERAKALGDHLTVGVTTQQYDDGRGKLNVRQSLMERVRSVEATGLADEVIVEEYEGQKIHDIQRLGIDIFAIGSDWTGKFDYLRDYCEVVYLERTRGISSTRLRDESQPSLNLGVVGAGRIARRFVREARFVSGVNIDAVHSRTPGRAKDFADELELGTVHDTYEGLLAACDAVYIATPHQYHYAQARAAIDAGRHVLCEKPVALTRADAEELYARADAAGVVLLEALKTAFLPGFQRMIGVARSGSIGDIRAVDATFTKLVPSGRELEGPDGGSLSELASYPLLAIIKLLGTQPDRMTTRSLRTQTGVDTFARIDLDFPHAIASATTGLGVKSEGDLVVSGTRGYLYVPAPWWLTEYFESRFEDPSHNRKFYVKMEGDGLRYEVAEFASMIRLGTAESYLLRREESVAIADMIERARRGAELPPDSAVMRTSTDSFPGRPGDTIHRI
ncbi:Gfo/Idh/MocA family oxidoreductase [Propionicimonas sp.]|uniref:Gfo/Idh/MocA family oxidoreductase n=1 Tax=Propionicimonas sp. TaxID=1955623 RepID=UPI0039E6E74F